MQFLRLLALAATASAAFCSTSSTSNDVSSRDTDGTSSASNSPEQLLSFSLFVDKFYKQKNVTAAFLDHVDVNYIQHNPFALSGRQRAIDLLSTFVPLSNFSLIHVGMDTNNTGYVHYRLDFPGSDPQAVVDIYRFQEACVMEHWDVAQTRPNNTINPIALF